MKMNNIQDAGRVQQGGSGRELLQAGAAGGSSPETSAKNSQEAEQAEPVDFYIPVANEYNDEVMFSEWENLLSCPELEESDRINPQIKMWNEPGTFEVLEHKTDRNTFDDVIKLRNDEAGITVDYEQIPPPMPFMKEVRIHKEVTFDSPENQDKNFEDIFMPYATLPKPSRLYGSISTDKNEDSKPLELEISNFGRQKISVLEESDIEFLLQPGDISTEVIKVDTDFTDETKDTIELRSKDHNVFITYTEELDPENENQVIMTKDVKFADDSDKDFRREEVREKYTPVMAEVDGETVSLDAFEETLEAAPLLQEASAETQDAGTEYSAQLEQQEEKKTDVYIPVATTKKSSALNFEWKNLENLADLQNTEVVNPIVAVWPSQYKGIINEYNNDNPDSQLENIAIRDEGSEATITFDRKGESVEKQVEHDNDFRKHRDFKCSFDPNVELHNEIEKQTLNINTEKEESDLYNEWNSLKNFPALNDEITNDIELQPAGGTAQLITYDITDNPDTPKRLEVKDYENGVTLSYTAEKKDEETATVVKKAEFRNDEEKNYTRTEEVKLRNIFPGN
jgi:hypothetical protein